MELIELALWNEAYARYNKGDKIPWNDRDFSYRMHENHLNQSHDWASRRKEIIHEHTKWITKNLPPTPSRILDLGCGPGFYMQNLAQTGHHCVGIDFSPASIEYAREQAARSNLPIEYHLEDIRHYKNNQKFDCIIMTFGEFNVFTKEDARAILSNCSEMLNDNGVFILEAHTFEGVHSAGLAPATWQRYTSGLFSDKPHLCLQENLWNAADATAVSQYFIIDAVSAEVEQYASFMQAYTTPEYKEMACACGLSVQDVLDEQTWFPGEDFLGKLQVFVCKKNQPSVESSSI